MLSGSQTLFIAFGRVHIAIYHRVPKRPLLDPALREPCIWKLAKPESGPVLLGSLLEDMFGNINRGI